MNDPAPDLTVAVLTYRRPRHVTEIVPALLQQLDSVADRCNTARLLVVDNNPDASARAQVSAVDDPRVRYVHEPAPGIAAARNRALDAAGEAGVLVFIDDDERPTERWLRSLLDTYLAHRPAGVVGPILCVFEDEPEDWIREGGFFTRRRLPTGARTDVAATNNLLLDLDVVRGLDLRFDERFSRIGGSDHLFTSRLVRSGGTLLWNNEALVLDLIPAERTTRRWVTRRAFRIGAGAGLVAVALAAGPGGRVRARAHHLVAGLIRVAGGLLRIAAGLATRSVGRRAAGTRNLWRGMGLVAGAFGRGYHQYRRPAGNPASTPTEVAA